MVVHPIRIIKILGLKRARRRCPYNVLYILASIGTRWLVICLAKVILIIHLTLWLEPNVYCVVVMVHIPKYIKNARR